MVIIFYSEPTDEIRGKTRRYLCEARANVFHGNISAAVRESLWNQICNDGISAMMFYSDSNEQGYSWKSNGEGTAKCIDFDGIILPCRNHYLCLDEIYAKPDIKILEHSSDTALVAEAYMESGRAYSAINALSERTGVDSKSLTDCICFCAFVHDVGKIHPSWQADLSEDIHMALLAYGAEIPKCEHIRHERYSRIIVTEYLKEKIGTDCDGEEIAEVIGDVIAHHHQNREGSIYQEVGKDIPDVTDSWKCMQLQMCDEAFAKYPVSSEIFKINEYTSMFAYTMLAVINTADWISSDKGWDDYKKEHRTQCIKAIAESFLADNGMSRTVIRDSRSFEEVFGFEPNPLQKTVIDISENPFRLMLIEYPCGGGKTEAAQWAALRMAELTGKSGEYVAMPTAVTAQDMAKRLRGIFPSRKFPEFTGMAKWSDNEEDNIDRELWVSDGRVKMLFPDAVGTIDQILKTVNAVRYSWLAMPGIADKVIVIDEVHSYDAYMLKELDMFLRWCNAFDVPVILLSATLSSRLKEKLFSDYGIKVKCSSGDTYPLISTVSIQGEFETFPVDCDGRDIRIDIIESESDIVTAMNKELEKYKHGCIAAILPTVDTCIEAHKELGKGTVIHARDTLENRAVTTKRILDSYGKEARKKGTRPDSSVCIATSVIEQALDVSFDGMLTAIAPVDLLIQRIGRVKRHDAITGCIGISVILADSPSVYLPDIRRNTVEVLKQCPRFNTVTDARKLIDYVYDESKMENTLSKEEISMLKPVLIKEPEKKSGTIVDDASYQLYRNRFAQTREETYPTKTIVLMGKDSVISDGKEFAAWAHKNSVQVAEYKLEGVPMEKGDGRNDDLYFVFIEDDGWVHGEGKRMQIQTDGNGLVIEDE